MKMTPMILVGLLIFVMYCVFNSSRLILENWSNLNSVEWFVAAGIGLFMMGFTKHFFGEQNTPSDGARSNVEPS
jgi:hypothetical protein